MPSLGTHVRRSTSWDTVRKARFTTESAAEIFPDSRNFAESSRSTSEVGVLDQEIEGRQGCERDADLAIAKSPEKALEKSCLSHDALEHKCYFCIASASVLTTNSTCPPTSYHALRYIRDGWHYQNYQEPGEKVYRCGTTKLLRKLSKKSNTLRTTITCRRVCG